MASRWKSRSTSWLSTEPNISWAFMRTNETYYWLRKSRCPLSKNSPQCRALDGGCPPPSQRGAGQAVQDEHLYERIRQGREENCGGRSPVAGCLIDRPRRS